MVKTDFIRSVKLTENDLLKFFSSPNIFIKTKMLRLVSEVNSQLCKKCKIFYEITEQMKAIRYFAKISISDVR